MRVLRSTPTGWVDQCLLLSILTVVSYSPCRVDRKGRRCYNRDGLLGVGRGDRQDKADSRGEERSEVSMKCEVCKNHSATVHLTDVSNNAKRELHLCENCAKLSDTDARRYTIEKLRRWKAEAEEEARRRLEWPSRGNDVY